MAYTPPHASVVQEFVQSPVLATNPLASCIVGPQYDLHRYSVDSEKNSTIPVNPTTPALGNAYQNGVDTAYLYPSRVAGSVVDQASAKLYIEQAVAQYFPLAALGSASASVAKVAIPATSNYYSNRLYSSALVFQTANSVSRSSVFSNRDVQIGDVLTVTDGTHSLTTAVAGFVAATVAASTGSVTNDAGNAPVQSEDHNNAAVPNAGNTGTYTTSNTSTAYKGYNALGIISDTFTITITGGTSLSNATFSVASASGAFALKTGLTLGSSILTIDDAGNNNVQLTLSGATTFTVGDSFTLSVVAPVVHITPVASGTYTGANDLTYKLTVVRGGPFYNGTNATTCARISVTSTNVDSSPAANIAASTSFTIGTLGLTVQIASGSVDGGLYVGDSYYVPVTAAAPGAVKTLIIKDALTAALLAGSLTITLSEVQTGVSVNKIRSLTGGTINWSNTATTVTVKSGMVLTDPLLVAGSDEVSLPVLTGNLFIEYRSVLQANTASVQSLTAPADVTAALGTIDPLNPLAQGVYNAVLNSKGSAVYYIAVPTDDITGYNSALAILAGKNVTYGLVYMGFDSTIQQAFVSHINTYSTPDEAKWRVAWLSSQLVSSAYTYNTQTGGSPWTATITQDPTVLTTSYTLLTMAGATFTTTARSGDTVLTNFSLAPDGSTINDTYTVDSVLTDTTLTLTSGPASPISVATSTKIKRNYTLQEQVDNLASVIASFANRRVRVVFPDSVANGSVVQDGYQVAAALAGLRSGVVPQQGLTNSQVLGFTDVSRASTLLNATQLNQLAAAGAFIVTQSIVGGIPYVRHQLTTDVSSINTQEDSITANVDSISYAMKAVLDPFIGKYNRNAETITLITNSVNQLLYFYQTGTASGTIGNQLIGFNIDFVTPDPTFKDRINIQVTLTVPYPINYITLTFVVP